MPKDFPEQRDPNARQDHEFAETSEISAADRALLDSATLEATRDQADREPGTLADEEDVYTDVATEPLSEETGVVPDTGYEDNEDGLDEIAEEVRREAEDRPTGRREDYTG